MHLSIKQKQVLGVTSIVFVMAVVMSVLHLSVLARVLLEESRERGEVLAEAVVHRAHEVIVDRETAYASIRDDPGVRSVLESAIYSQGVTYAALVDPGGMIVAHSDPKRIGERLPERADLDDLLDASSFAQLRAVYATGRTFEWRQPVLLNDQPFGEIHIGVSTLLVRRELDASLRPALVATIISIIVAIITSMLLSQLVLRPINVIQSGLTRLGRGELGVTLDLEDDEFKDLGDVFASLTEQLRSAAPEEVKRENLLELSRRVMAVGRLTAGVAHEVKNPLNAMMIHLELLKQKMAADMPAADTAPHVDVIAHEIRRLDDVVQGFLKFARPEELDLAPVRPALLVDEVLRVVGPEATAQGVTLDSASDDTAVVDGDQTMLRQALMNLARNALQAMPSGGRLRMSCAVTRDNRVELRVADTGVGIPPEALAKIFDLYFTTKASGTGIGLSLVYRTVQLHHGEIDVESTPGTGTVFVIKLPAAR